MTNTNLNEDHFSPDQVAQIKACSDESVRSFYKKYLQAEAVGDQAAADRYADIITRRCGLLGVFTSAPVAEDETPAANNEYQRWEDRMKAAGAVAFKSDDPESPTVVRANKIVGGKHVELGEFDLINDKEMFESSKLMSKYTVEGQANDLSVWTESVLAEGATEIRDFKGGKVAYLGEARIGICRIKTPPRVVKKFNDILNESFNVSLNADSEGNKTITITASEGDAEQLAGILKLSGLGHHPAAQAQCDADIEVTEEYANAPDEKYADSDTQLNRMAGGLNKPKRMSNPNNPADNPLAMGKLGVKGGKQLNIEEAKLAESLESEFANFAIRVDESVDSEIRSTRALIQKLKAQQQQGSPLGDVSQKLKAARATLEKLKKQKQLGIDFGNNQLNELSPETREAYRKKRLQQYPGGLAEPRPEKITKGIQRAYYGRRNWEPGKKGDNGDSIQKQYYSGEPGSRYLGDDIDELSPATTAVESVDSELRAVRAKITKLKTQQQQGSPFGDVTQQLRSARAKLDKLKKQKQSGVQLDELSPATYKNYIDTATGDHAHTNAQRLRAPRDQQKPFLDRMKKRNAGLARAQSGLDRYADDVVREDVEAEGNIGDEVIITGNVQFNGATGVIADFGQDRRFVIVDLYNHGKRSFHASDVSLNDYADSDEEAADMYDRDEDYRDWNSEFGDER